MRRVFFLGSTFHVFLFCFFPFLLRWIFTDLPSPLSFFSFSGNLCRFFLYFLYIVLWLLSASFLMDVRSKRPAVSSSSSSAPRSCRSRHLDFFSGLPQYVDSGDCICVCEFCGAYFWYLERVAKFSTPAHPRYSHCCRDGGVVLPYPPAFDPDFVALYENVSFMKDIRAYNSMFSMTSFGANVDHAVNEDRGPYVFKISGQISHTIGSLSPDPVKGPRFLQLYLFDTDHEV